MIHSRDNALHFYAYSNNPQHAIQSVSRSQLNLTLLHAAAAEPNVVITFNQQCTHADALRGELAMVDTKTGAEYTLTGDLIVGTDGAYSAIRGAMQKTEGFDFDQSWLGHGYKEMLIPPVASGPHAPFAMEPAALHIWPRGSSMMIALPNPDGSFTCTLFWPHKGEGSFAGVVGRQAAREHFQREYADALPLMPTFDADFTANPVGSMLTIRCQPWSMHGRMALLGDAAHAIVPFFGQGANASFEDCEALADALVASPNDMPGALANYERMRKRNADAIAQMALENFIEMRDRTTSRIFLAKKKINHFLHSLFPTVWVPRYDMVSFDTIPYAEALQRSRRQDRMLLTSLMALAVVVAGAMVLAARWLLGGKSGL